jgi:hypothetical protein
VKTCIEITNIEGPPIKLVQKGVDNFSVVYGLEVNDKLNYPMAASALGRAIMHALACAGKLDNREKGESDASEL